MTRARAARRTVVCATLAAAFGIVQGSLAQDAGQQGGIRVILDYSLGARLESNEDLAVESPGVSKVLSNSLGFALSSNTRTQQLALTFGTEFLIEDDPEDTTLYEWSDPTFALSYSRQAANARLALSASLLTREVDTLEPFFIDVDGDTVIDAAGFSNSEGTLTQFNTNLVLDTGITAPLGTLYSFSYNSRTYSDTEDPSLSDRNAWSFRTETRLRFSDVTTGRVTTSFRETETTGATDETTRTYSIGTGLARDLSPVLRFDVLVGYTHSTTEEPDGSETFVDGINANASLVRTLRDGSLTATFTRTFNSDRFRDTVSIGRTFTMPRYTLSARAGLSSVEGVDPTTEYEVAYSRILDDGAISARLSRAVRISTEDEERVVTALGVDYSKEINALSSFGLGLSYNIVGFEGEEGDNTTQASVSASYRHAITRDWALSVGYRGRYKETTGDAFSNAVFVDVGRSFSIRP